MSKSIEDKLADLIDKERNNRSYELFNKPEIDLQIAEREKLDKYIYDLNNPIWKPIIINGNQTDYQISNTGIVKGKRDNIMKPSMNPDNYLNISLYYYEGDLHILRRFGIHRLVAIAFIPNPENKPQVNHINGNKSINWVGNLEWMTQQENIQHAIDNGLRDIFLGVNSPKNVYPEETIHKICKLLEAGKTQLEISNELSVNKGVVNGIKQEKMWKHISKNYNIPKPKSRPNPRPPHLRSDVIKLLESGITDAHEICKLLGLPDDRRNRIYVCVIRNETMSKVQASTTIENTGVNEKYVTTGK